MQANNILQFSQNNQQDNNTRPTQNKVAQSMTPEGPLGELINFTYEWTNDTIATLFDNVDTQLFEMAEKAENSTDQNTYFDAMRIIRLRRSIAHEEFINNVRQSFTLEVLQNGLNSSHSEKVADMDNLSLVADDHLEEDLATHNMVSKAERDNKDALKFLNQRLGYLYKGLEITSENNPLGPTALCDCFAVAANSLDAEITVKLLIFKLFDINVVNKLKDLYQQANDLLIEQNILPDLKTSYKGVSVKKQASPSGYASQNNNNGNDNIANASVDANPPMQNNLGGLGGLIQQPMDNTQQNADAQAFALIQQLIAQNRPQQAAPQQGFATTDDIVSSLNAVQVNNEQLQFNNGFSGAGAATSNLLKEALQQSLQNQQTINQGDDDLIDVIGMLFDFILDDDNLVDSVKSLLSRLQIPIIKIALQDKTFFKNKNHPTRKLLNELASAGLGVTDNIDVHNNPLYLKLEHIVAQLSSENSQHNNIEFFEELLDDLHRFLIQFNQGISTKHTPSKAAALELVNTELDARTSQNELPANIILLLERVWKDVMLDIFFNDGMESDEWDMAITFIDTLIWSIVPKADMQSQKQLVRVIPGILNALNAGLDRVQYPKAARDQLLQDLQNCHLACMKGQNINNTELSQNTETYVSTQQRHEQLQKDREKAATKPGELTPEELERIDAGVDIMLSSDLSNLDALDEETLLASLEDGSEAAIADIEEMDENELIEDEFTQQARDLEAGSWVEFIGANDKSYRAKISWMSEDSSAYIFVTQTGQIAEKSLIGLSFALRNNQAHLLDETPVFERAMDAVLEDLQEHTE